jgi:hypothetical protein
VVTHVSIEMPVELPRMLGGSNTSLLSDVVNTTWPFAIYAPDSRVPFNPLMESRAVPSLKEYLWRRYKLTNVEGDAVGVTLGAALGLSERVGAAEGLTDGLRLGLYEGSIVG